jgi:hypothetical protein
MIKALITAPFISDEAFHNLWELDGLYPLPMPANPNIAEQTDCHHRNLNLGINEE